LWQEYVYDPIWKEYMLVGMVGPKKGVGVEGITYFSE